MSDSRPRRWPIAGFVAALIASTLLGAAVLWTGEWQLRARADTLATSFAQQALQATPGSDWMALTLALERLPMGFPDLIAARIVTTDDEIIASPAGEEPSSLSSFEVSVPIAIAGDLPNAHLELRFSRARLLGTALFAVMCSVVVLTIVAIALPSRSSGTDPRAARRAQGPADQPGPLSGQAPNLDGKRVLIADDSEISRRLLSLYIKRHGGLSDEASDGVEALELAARNQYACMLLDLRMPRLDGSAAARQLKQICPRTPLIAVTAQSDPEAPGSLSDAFDTYLVKPVTEANLITVLSELTSKSSRAAQVEVDQSFALDEPSAHPDVHDPRRALELAGGIESLAAELFSILKRELADQLPVLSDTTTARGMQREIAHKLRASARYCATLTLEQRATDLEEAITRGAPQAEIDGARRGLCRAMEELLKISQSA